jgi:hypothetical protein
MYKMEIKHNALPYPRHPHVPQAGIPAGFAKNSYQSTLPSPDCTAMALTRQAVN